MKWNPNYDKIPVGFNCLAKNYDSSSEKLLKDKSKCNKYLLEFNNTFTID